MGLPSGYTQLEYIQSSGTQYIDVGFKPNQDTRITASVIWPLSGASRSNYLCGARESGSAKKYAINGYGGKYESHYGTNTVSAWNSVSEQFSIDKNKNVTTIYGVTETQGAQTFQCPVNMFLFAMNNNGAMYSPASVKLYQFSVYDNGTLVRDYIPCQTTAGEIGLWDDVNGLFYGNAGTGTFTAGPVIAIAADASEITKLEYIQSNGTQYIDTGIVPKSNTRVDADCDVTYGTDWIMILGSYDPNKYFAWWANGAKIYAYYGTSNKNVAGENGKQTLSANKNIWTAGNSAMSFSEASFTANASIYLFSVNNGGNYSNASMKLYSCQIYDNGTLVRDYIPAKLSDGTVGLYDKLNGLLYINAGTGTFTAGPEVKLGGIYVKVDGVWKKVNNVSVNVY